jgi:hypothetical protein
MPSPFCFWAPGYFGKYAPCAQKHVCVATEGLRPSVLPDRQIWLPEIAFGAGLFLGAGLFWEICALRPKTCMRRDRRAPPFSTSRWVDMAAGDCLWRRAVFGRWAVWEICALRPKTCMRRDRRAPPFSTFRWADNAAGICIFQLVKS